MKRLSGTKSKRKKCKPKKMKKKLCKEIGSGTLVIAVRITPYEQITNAFVIYLFLFCVIHIWMTLKPLYNVAWQAGWLVIHHAVCISKQRKEAKKHVHTICAHSHAVMHSQSNLVGTRKNLNKRNSFVQQKILNKYDNAHGDRERSQLVWNVRMNYGSVRPLKPYMAWEITKKKNYQKI